MKKEFSVDADKEAQIPNIKNPEVQPLFYQKSSNDPITLCIPSIKKIEYPEYTPDFILSTLAFCVFQPPEVV